MYIPYYIPPGYWRKFRYRAYRLYGIKVPSSYREELLKRVGYRHGSIRSNRFGRQMSAILKECYSDYIPELIQPSSRFLKTIDKSK
jgi:hypothetical protein